MPGFFDFVTPRLATGGAITGPADVQALVAAGVNAIVDCRDDFNDGALLANVPGMMYLWNPTADDGQPKPAEWFQASLSFAMPLLAKPHVKAYFHCQGGVNRGPSTCYAVMLAQGFPKDLARAMILKARPVAVARYADDAERAVAVLGYV